MAGFLGVMRYRQLPGLSTTRIVPAGSSQPCSEITASHLTRFGEHRTQSLPSKGNAIIVPNFPVVDSAAAGRLITAIHNLDTGRSRARTSFLQDSFALPAAQHGWPLPRMLGGGGGLFFERGAPARGEALV